MARQVGRAGMLRKILFRLHWLLGLTAGLVLALMGVTGALMSYEEAVTDWANADRAFVSPSAAPRLGPEALVAHLAAQRPGLTVNALTLAGDPERSPRARFAVDRRTGERPPSVYLDPVDGHERGAVRLENTFATIRDLHRWLLLPEDGKGWGRSITGASTIALLVFLATGLYLRWPKIHSWRIWLKPALKRPGRPRWWSLHSIVGTWLVPVYLVVAVSGLTWSYEPVKQAATWMLTGETPKPKPARSGPKAPAATEKAAPALDKAWAAFLAGEGADAPLAILTLPGPDATAIRIRYLAHGAGASRARNDMSFDAATGAVLSVSRDADKALGQSVADNMLEVHRGRFFGGVFALIFCAAALLMPLMAATGLVLYVLRRRAGRRRALAAAGPPGIATGARV